MTSVPRPSPCFLDQMIPIGAPAGVKRWKNTTGDRLYEWDAYHGEIEVYNARGKHLGVLHPVTGTVIKPAVKGRTIDV